MTKITATFTPEAWVNNQAIEVDAEGPVSWDATSYAATKPEYLQRFITAFDGDLNGEILDNDDVFKHDPDAPKWIRNWTGPFSIWLRVEDSEHALDHSEIQEALAFISPLTERQCTLVEILLHPDNDPSERATDPLDSMDEFVSIDDTREMILAVGERLRCHYNQAANSFDEFLLEMISSEDPNSQAFTVSTRIVPLFWLSLNTSVTHLDTLMRPHQGLPTVLAVAEVIDDLFTQIRAKRSEIERALGDAA